MYTSSTQIRVRYGETDQMGFLYYGHYALYYEVGRAEAIRQLGFTYKELEALGIHMPVVELQCRYLRPARYDDLLTVTTTLRELPAGSSVKFHVEIFNEAGELLNTGAVTLVFFDPAAQRKTGLHPELRLRLEPFFSQDVKSAS